VCSALRSSHRFSSPTETSFSRHARKGSPKFETAAIRWLARLAAEGRDVRLDELQMAVAAFGCLRGRRREQAEKTLLRFL
jgi:hypothetical protein